ncbi:hypothetical protein BpHYR1_037678 [Brachionus plicatilis]|uniref:Uncharacterized protein n=1 Tax=Brachionus plicatilis TaxID=10195 RepID=A0A3M7QWP4_BRAPC|nr:hypothetical protein BpHYR1_037678 [Brachionus plicatilis]
MISTVDRSIVWKKYFEEGLNSLHEVAALFNRNSEHESDEEDNSQTPSDNYDEFDQSGEETEQQYLDSDGISCLMSITRSSLNSDTGDNEFNDKIKKEIDCFKVLINNVRSSSTVRFLERKYKENTNFV